MFKYTLTIISILFLLHVNAQTYYILGPATVVGNYNGTYQYDLNNCDTVRTLYTCLDTYGDGTYFDMAIDTSGNLYWVSVEGALFTSKFNDSTSCQFLGVFDNDSDIQGLVANLNGDILAIGTNGYNDRTKLYKYQPEIKKFSTIGVLPSEYEAASDLFFYEGRLFYTAYASSGAAVIEINIENTLQSCYYMGLGKMNPYAAFSIQNGTCSEAYVVSTNGGPSTLYKLDLYAKTYSAPLCTYPFEVNGAASIYKFSPSIIDSNSCLPVDSTVCTTMPVTLLNFSYTLLNKTVNLQWQTTTEINSNYFLIQRSADGTNFSTIGKQPAANNSSTLKQYTFTDNGPLSINYYRLKEVDLNGNSTYSNTLLVKLPQATALQILQNPVQNSLQVQVNSGQPKTSSLTIFDFSGRRLKTLTVTNGVQTIDISTLPDGVYILQLITNNGDLYNQRFVRGK